MALTKLQAEAVVKLFALSFAHNDSEKIRKEIFLEFEDTFGRGIADWHSICKEIIEQHTSDKDVIEHFDMLVYRKENQNEWSECLIRQLKESDLEAVIELINSAFSMMLTSYDNERFEKFMESGYSFVACNNDEILGVVLGYLAPDLNMDAVYLDTFTVSETVRGHGIGRMLLRHVSKCASSNHIHLLKLHTNRSIEAYKIYKHWGFRESELVLMKRYG